MFMMRSWRSVCFKVKNLCVLCSRKKEKDWIRVLSRDVCVVIFSRLVSGRLGLLFVSVKHILFFSSPGAGAFARPQARVRRIEE